MVIDKIVSNTEGTAFVAAAHTFETLGSTERRIAVLLYSSDGESWNYGAGCSFGSTVGYPYALDLCYAHGKFWAITFLSQTDLSGIEMGNVPISGSLFYTSETDLANWSTHTSISNVGACGVIDGQLWVKAGSGDSHNWYKYNASTDTFANQFSSYMGQANLNSPILYYDEACSPIELGVVVIDDSENSDVHYVLTYYDTAGTIHQIDTELDYIGAGSYMKNIVVGNGHIILEAMMTFDE